MSFGVKGRLGLTLLVTVRLVEILFRFNNWSKTKVER